MKQNRWIVPGIILIIIAIVVMNTEYNRTKSTIGKMSPPVSVTLINGKTVTLESLREKEVIEFKRHQS